LRKKFINNVALAKNFLVTSEGTGQMSLGFTSQVEWQVKV